jgi:outer membrane protein assembly factor BamD (BamD/ComL family)
MGRWRIYRVLAVIAVLALGAAVREHEEAAAAVARAQARATDILLALYPDLPKHLYFRGLSSLNAGDRITARRLFEAALAQHFYTNEGLLHNYAVVLVELDAPREEIDRAIALWKKHFPHSKNPDPLEYRNEGPGAG